MTENKSKKHTSTAVKRRYNDKAYKMVRAELKKELVTEWETRLLQDGISKAEFIRRAIVKYLEDTNE